MYKENKQQVKLSFFDHAMELVGWLQIVASPLLGGFLLGGIAYLYVGNTVGLVAGILITILGLAVGIIIANRVLKNKGTINFMSSVNASPELDNEEPVSDKANSS